MKHCLFTALIFTIHISAFSASLDGVWYDKPNDLFLILQERNEGELIGYLPGSPGTSVIDAQRSWLGVEIEFRSINPGSTTFSTFNGVLADSGKALFGIYTNGSVSVPVTLKKSTTAFLYERWILANAMGTGKVRLGKVLDPVGAFTLGQLVGMENCDFISCESTINSWTVAGSAHSINTSSAGGCPSSSTLSGTLDPAVPQLVGSFSTSNCTGLSSGLFGGGKEGIADGETTQAVLRLLVKFAESIEARSLTDVDKTISSAFLHDGKTKADMMADFADLFSAYDSLTATIDAVDQVVTANDAEVHPFVEAPPRVEWRLLVRGEPASGGPTTTALDWQFSSNVSGDETLMWIGEEAGKTVFIGNGYGTPFGIQLPVAFGETARVASGVWPYGVHGGGHPEGHQGMDIEYAPGAKVRAMADGVVSDIRFNSGSGTWSLSIIHRPGRRTSYNELSTVFVSPGDAVLMGDSIGDPGVITDGGGTRYQIHFGMNHWLTDVCPVYYFNSAGAGLFDLIWGDARYNEELVEPFPCNPTGVSFPLRLVWQKQSGGLSPQIEFVRLNSTTSDYEYNLRDASGSIIETGAVVNFSPTNTPFPSFELQPAGSGLTRFAIYDLNAQTMRIAWSTGIPPTNLATASVYVPQP